MKTSRGRAEAAFGHQACELARLTLQHTTGQAETPIEVDVISGRWGGLVLHGHEVVDFGLAEARRESQTGQFVAHCLGGQIPRHHQYPGRHVRVMVSR